MYDDHRGAYAPVEATEYGMPRNDYVHADEHQQPQNASNVNNVDNAIQVPGYPYSLNSVDQDERIDYRQDHHKDGRP